MGRIHIDADAISLIGDHLGDIADYLESRASYANDTTVDTYGFLGHAGQPFNRVLGDYERRRRQICGNLRALDDLAQEAGGLYIETEGFIDSTMRRQS